MKKRAVGTLLATLGLTVKNQLSGSPAGIETNTPPVASRVLERSYANFGSGSRKLGGKNETPGGEV